MHLNSALAPQCFNRGGIGWWLASLPQDIHPVLIRVSRGLEILALGIVCRAHVRGTLVTARALLLNETATRA